MRSDCGGSTGSISDDEEGELTQMEVMKERLELAEEQMERARKQNKTGRWVTETERQIKTMKRMIREGPRKDIRVIETFLGQANERYLTQMADWAGPRTPFQQLSGAFCGLLRRCGAF